LLHLEQGFLNFGSDGACSTSGILGFISDRLSSTFEVLGPIFEVLGPIFEVLGPIFEVFGSIYEVFGSIYEVLCSLFGDTILLHVVSFRCLLQGYFLLR
jgi:hypothetical protein